MPIHFEDRQAKYPNRWTMTKSDGTSEVVTLIRNDEPIVDGTPMNAETLNSLSDVAGADLARALAESARTEAQTAASNAASSASAAATSETNSAASEAAAKGSADSAAASAELAGTRASTDKTLSIEDAPADAAAVRALIKKLLAAQREEDYAKIKFWVSTESTSPAELFGGTWEQITDRFIVAAGGSYGYGSTGGAKTVTLTKENLPNYALNKACLSAVTDCYGAKIEQLKWGATGAWHGDMMLGGSSKAFGILPPYLALYMWRRVDDAT